MKRMTSIRPMMMNRRMRHGSAATTRIWMPIFICVLVSQWCVLVTKQLGSPHYVGIYVSAADVIDERKEEYPQIRSSSSSSTASRSSSSSSSTTPGSSSSSSSGSNKATADAGSSTSTFRQILAKAARRGMGGGISGAIAGIVQVLTLMWIRTIISYQTRYGTGFQEALSVLYKEGGIARLYRGLGFALIQAPLARFGSTAANDGVEALIAGLDLTDSWGSGRSTVIASIVVGLWRILLMPIDTCKTVLQVDNKEGFRNLMKRVREGKFFVLYQGAAAIAMSSIMGHYPWFFTYNVLSKSDWLLTAIPSKLLRNAAIGLAASIVSDTMVNSLRVIKTTKQSVGTKHEVSYVETIRLVLAVDGWTGLFGRGLRTRILANSLQSIVFTIIWRSLADR